MQDLLKEYIDIQYKEFCEKLFDKPVKMLGIRIPTLKKLAKDFPFTEDMLEKEYTYMEEKMLLLFCIANKKENRLYYLEKSIQLIDNWSLCDSFSSAFKISKKEQEIFLPWILENIYSNSTYRARLAICLLKNYYLEDNYIDICLENLVKVNSKEYYVQMAISWTLQKVYTKYKQKVIDILSKNTLPSFVQNKTISKICDSKTTTKEEKEYLKKLKARD